MMVDVIPVKHIKISKKVIQLGVQFNLKSSEGLGGGGGAAARPMMIEHDDSIRGAKSSRGVGGGCHPPP